MTIIKFVRTCLVAAGVAMTAGISHATAYYWTGATSSEFATPGNWVTGSATSRTVPTVAPKDNNYSDKVYFTTNANPVRKSVEVSANQKVNEIYFTGTGWTLTGARLLAKKITVNEGSGTVTAANLGLTNAGTGNGYVVASGCVLDLTDSFAESTAALQLDGGGTLHFQNQSTFNWYSDGGSFLITGDSLLITDQPYTKFTNLQNNYAWMLKLNSAGARFQCMNTPTELEQRFNTTVKKSWNFTNTFDSVNYELAVRALTETTSEVYLKQKGSGEDDPFNLGVPSASGTFAKGITMSCAISDFNTAQPVELRLSFGADAAALTQIKTWSVTGDGTFSHTQTSGIDVGTKYFYQFVCEGTTNGAPCVKRTAVCSYVVPGVSTWIAAAEDAEGNPATNSWTVVANWEDGIVPRTLSDVVFSNSAAVVATGRQSAKTLTLTNAASVAFVSGDYAFGGAANLGVGSANNALTVASGATLAADGLYLDESNASATAPHYGYQSLIVSAGATVTTRELKSTDNHSSVTVDGGTLVATNLYNAMRFKNTSAVNASTLSVKNGGTFKVPGTLYLNRHVDGARLYVTDRSTCEVGTLDMGSGADGGYDGELILSNATMSVTSLLSQSFDTYRRSRIALYEDDGESTVLSCGDLKLGIVANNCRAGYENELRLYGGSVAVSGDLMLGGSVNSTNNLLMIAGGRVTAGNLVVQNKSVLHFSIPAAGYGTAALSASGTVGFADSKIEIDATACVADGWITLVSAAGGLSGITKENLAEIVEIQGEYKSGAPKVRLVRQGDAVTALQIRLRKGFAVLVR